MNFKVIFPTMVYSITEAKNRSIHFKKMENLILKSEKITSNISRFSGRFHKFHMLLEISSKHMREHAGDDNIQTLLKQLSFDIQEHKG